jgi:hypothetical protein
MDQTAIALSNLSLISTLPTIITSTSQLPEFDRDILSFYQTPCMIQAVDLLETFCGGSAIRDPYLKSLVTLFTQTNTICSTELSQNIKFCHPLWNALRISNDLKQDSELIPYFSNLYMHSIQEYSEAKHICSHFPLPTYHQL